MEWYTYVGEYDKPVNTSPHIFLHYLLNVVLSNLVSKKLYLSLIINIDTMISMELVTTENSKTYRLDVSQIINRVLAKLVFNQSGAKLLKKENQYIKRNQCIKGKKKQKNKNLILLVKLL